MVVSGEGQPITAVPKLFGLLTPFAVKYFSWTPDGLANNKDI